MKDLSVIIVSYKGWERLSRCLDSLSAFKGCLFDMEVLVVDNSSDGEIKEIEKKYPGFGFIQNSLNGGFGNGCNLGAEKACGRFLLFLNPDTEVKEEEIGKLLHLSEQRKDYYVTSCRQVDENGRESRATGDFPGPWNLTGFQRSLAGLFRGKADGKDVDVIFPDDKRIRRRFLDVL
jgi:GT2 family glycosyltransferase